MNATHTPAWMAKAVLSRRRVHTSGRSSTQITQAWIERASAVARIAQIGQKVLVDVSAQMITSSRSTPPTTIPWTRTPRRRADCSASSGRVVVGSPSRVLESVREPAASARTRWAVPSRTSAPTGTSASDFASVFTCQMPTSMPFDGAQYQAGANSSPNPTATATDQAERDAEAHRQPEDQISPARARRSDL